MKQWKRERRKKIGKISEEAKRIALRLSPWLAAKRIYNRGSFYWLAAAPSFSCPGFPSLSSHAGTPPPPPSLYRKWDSVSLLTFSRPSEDLTQRRAKLAATVVPWIVTEKERKPSCSLQALLQPASPPPWTSNWWHCWLCWPWPHMFRPPTVSPEGQQPL